MSGSLQVTSTSKKTQPPTIKQLVSAKMAIADIKGAVRIIVSKDTILALSQETLQKFRQKHPTKHTDSQNSPEIEEESKCFQTIKEDLMRALHSFKKGAAGGPDGLLPQHLIDMSGSALGEPVTQLVNSLVSSMNLIVFPGKIPKELCETFYGATLIALSKKDGRVRPIAIGFSLRRLAAKITMFANKNFSATHFIPHQLGAPKVAETCVHAVRSYLLSQSSKGKVLNKIDFKNAFNTVRGDVILNLVKTKIPSMYNFIHQCYDINTNLIFGDEVLNSREGFQQGDPLGPFLFSLGIQDIVNDLRSELNVFYLDNGTLEGDVETVVGDLLKIKSALHTHRLELNPTKCELYVINSEDNLNPLNATIVKNQFNEVCYGIKIIERKHLSLLGAPLFPEAVSSIMESKLENLKLMLSRLKEIDSHEALFLLRHCFAIPKLIYFLRTTPCFMVESILGSFDKIIKDSLVDILNISLSTTAHKQLNLPIA